MGGGDENVMMSDIIPANVRPSVQEGGGGRQNHAVQDLVPARRHKRLTFRQTLEVRKAQ